jgi:hypothetical protein
VLQESCSSLLLVPDTLFFLLFVATASPGLGSFHFELGLLSHNWDQIWIGHSCTWGGSGLGFLFFLSGFWEISLEVGNQLVAGADFVLPCLGFSE